MSSLEEILKYGFGCKKPFLKRRKLVYESEDGEKKYEYLTKSGVGAYEKLVDVVYALGEIGVIDNSEHIVEVLDSIVDSEEM